MARSWHFCSANEERGNKKTRVCYSSTGLEMTDIHKGKCEKLLNILSLDVNHKSGIRAQFCRFPTERVCVCKWHNAEAR